MLFYSILGVLFLKRQSKLRNPNKAWISETEIEWERDVNDKSKKKAVIMAKLGNGLLK